MHTIRLRGPWELEVLSRSEEQGTSAATPADERARTVCRCSMPSDWSSVLGVDFHGVVRHRRRFNRPTNLELHERVWLVLEPPRSRGRVSINGQPLGLVLHHGPVGRFDITRQLADHNAVEIDVEHTANDGDQHGPGGLVGEVRLEIAPIAPA